MALTKINGNLTQEHLAATSPFLLHPQSDHLSYTKLFQRYENSVYGQHHATQTLRYNEHFGYDHSQMLSDLGDDIHPVRHMVHTESNIFRKLAQSQVSANGLQKFTTKEIVAGRLGALLHDIGECELPELENHTGVKPIGDIPFHDKTDDHEETEKHIRSHIVSQLFHDIPHEIMEIAEDTIANKRGTLLREGFNVSEHIGYMLTGIQAGEVALEIKNKEDNLEIRFRQLSKLALQVAPTHYEYIGENGKDFQYVNEVRQKAAPLIDKIVNGLS